MTFTGEFVSCRGQLNVAEVHPFPVLLSALGPHMLKLAGTLADGTITWMTGPVTLRDHTVPIITDAARSAGRSEPPRAVVGLPICVTQTIRTPRKDRAPCGVRHVREISPRIGRCSTGKAQTGRLTSAIIGTENSVRAKIAKIADAGGDADFMAAEFWASRADRDRTRDLRARALLGLNPGRRHPIGEARPTRRCDAVRRSGFVSRSQSDFRLSP